MEDVGLVKEIFVSGFSPPKPSSVFLVQLTEKLYVLSVESRQTRLDINILCQVELFPHEIPNNNTQMQPSIRPFEVRIIQM